MRYELTDFEWAAIKPYLPNKPRGVPRVNDTRPKTAKLLLSKMKLSRFGPFSEAYLKLGSLDRLMADRVDERRQEGAALRGLVEKVGLEKRSRGGCRGRRSRRTGPARSGQTTSARCRRPRYRAPSNR
jgi:transposase